MKLSGPSLTKYLNELKEENIVEKTIHDDREKYTLTQRGKATELAKTRLLSAGLRTAGSIVKDQQTAQLFGKLANMAVEKPDAFHALMDWSLDLALLVSSNPNLESRWLRVLGGNKDEWQPFQREIEKRLELAPQPKNAEELRSVLETITAAIRETVSKDKRKGEN